MFSAAEEEGWRIITRAIDESDYYVVIIAHRYGSLIDKISFTEKEYDYASEKGVPILGFIIEDDAPWSSNRMEKDSQIREALDRFKEKARKRRLIGYWRTASDLKAECSISLMKAFNLNPRPGWIRSTESVGPEAANELARLGRENASLREQIANLKEKIGIYDQEFGRQVIDLMKSHNVELEFVRSDGFGNPVPFNKSLPVTLLAVFCQAAPIFALKNFLSTEESASTLATAIGNRKWGDQAKILSIASRQTHYLIMHLCALNLLGSNPGRRDIWELTPWGRKVYFGIYRQEVFPDGFPSRSETSAPDGSP